MPDFHLETIHFLNQLLKVQQLKLARAAHTAGFDQLQEEFEMLRQRLCLEIFYAMDAAE